MGLSRDGVLLGTQGQTLYYTLFSGSTAYFETYGGEFGHATETGASSGGTFVSSLTSPLVLCVHPTIPCSEAEPRSRIQKYNCKATSLE
jgi:hypothetical protein